MVASVMQYGWELRGLRHKMGLLSTYSQWHIITQEGDKAIQRTVTHMFSEKGKWDVNISSEVGRGKIVLGFLLNIDTLMVRRLLMKTWVRQIDKKNYKKEIEMLLSGSIAANYHPTL